MVRFISLVIAVLLAAAAVCATNDALVLDDALSASPRHGKKEEGAAISNFLHSGFGLPPGHHMEAKVKEV